MPSHTLLSGDVVEYAADPALSEFITRAALAVADASVGVADLVEILYGEENPLLTRGVIPGRGFVTPEVLQNPVYRVLLDLLDRKRVAVGRFDPAASDAAHTLTVQDAAKRLGISDGAVRQAITAGRLAAIKRGSQFWLREEAVASYRVSTRGPSGSRVPALRVRMGTIGDAVLQFRTDGAVETMQQAGHVRDAAVTSWTRAAVKTARKDLRTLRVFELRPGAVENAIRLDGLEVVGRFDIVQTHNNAREAEAAWKSYAAASE